MRTHQGAGILADFSFSYAVLDWFFFFSPVTSFCFKNHKILLSKQVQTMPVQPNTRQKGTSECLRLLCFLHLNAFQMFPFL